MDGIGTYGDPYIINTVEELYSIEQTGSPDTCYALGCDIDLNGSPAAYSFSPIVLNCRFLDGRGHSIRNIITGTCETGQHIFTVPEGVTKLLIAGLTVDNAHLTAPAVTLFSAVSCKIRLERCAFAVMGSNTAEVPVDVPFIGSGVTLSADLCSFVFHVRWQTQGRLIDGALLDRCQIRLRAEAVRMFDRTGIAVPMFDNMTAGDSFIMGSICCPDGYNRFCLLADICSFSNCYAVLKAEGEANVLNTINVRILTPCFYDSEVQGSGTLSMAGFQPLTTAQCKDAAYLRSIGFDCGEGEDYGT